MSAHWEQHVNFATHSRSPFVYERIGIAKQVLSKRSGVPKPDTHSNELCMAFVAIDDLMTAQEKDAPSSCLAARPCSSFLRGCTA